MAAKKRRLADILIRSLTELHDDLRAMKPEGLRKKYNYRAIKRDKVVGG